MSQIQIMSRCTRGEKFWNHWMSGYFCTCPYTKKPLKGDLKNIKLVAVLPVKAGIKQLLFWDFTRMPKLNSTI
jgi:hypothetical protein